MIAKAQPKFTLGQILATPGALEALQKAGQSAADFLNRHAHGDWGKLDDEDRQANDHALLDGSRILSAHHTSLGEKIWIITEATDEAGQGNHPNGGLSDVAFNRTRCQTGTRSDRSGKELSHRRFGFRLASAFAKFCLTRNFTMRRIKLRGIGLSSGNRRLPFSPA
jgi:hypothetical protein